MGVVTGQFCVPSKYGSHGEGFHEVGMLCQGAEPADNWASGAEFSRQFTGRGVFDERASPLAAPDWTRFGYFFKPAMLAMLRKTPEPLVVGGDDASQCHVAQSWYESRTFIQYCLCEMRAPSAVGCAAQGRHNVNPRFYAAPAGAFRTSAVEEDRSCASGLGVCSN